MTELEKVLGEVKQSAKQIAINKTDEVKVMVAMLNDKEFKYQKYEKNVGRVGEINPRSQMVNLATDIIFNAKFIFLPGIFNLYTSAIVPVPIISFLYV